MIGASLNNVLEFLLHSFPYFEVKICLHLPSSSTPNLYFHLAIKALLNIVMSFISNPPCSFDLHIYTQLIHVIFLPSLLQDHKNFL